MSKNKEESLRFTFKNGHTLTYTVKDPVKGSKKSIDMLPDIMSHMANDKIILVGDKLVINCGELSHVNVL